MEDDEIPIEDIVAAARQVVALTPCKYQHRLFHHIDSPQWRTWSNPEHLLSDKGIRLDNPDVDASLRVAVMAVLQATLSPEGYEKATSAMRINGFLGELTNTPTIMNEFSYNFVMFGREPSVEQPWGFAFYGHHLCINVFLHQRQMVIAPWFTGAEPNIIDQGPHKGTCILHKEESLGLELMQSLPPALQSEAQVYKGLKDDAMPHGRWNHDDQRHLCGAYRDNRIVPYEGVCVSQLSDQQQSLIGAIMEQYLLYLPKTARLRRLQHIKEFYDETYFCWIGGFGDEDAFYYRIQSPVILVEFDHHSGVFLTNKEPARFHIHTLLRMPNGGDYGMALRPLIQGLEQNFMWEG